ncbi:MAG: hypothetical protein WDO15_30285 [Bacteroidota bacterium]
MLKIAAASFWKMIIVKIQRVVGMAMLMFLVSQCAVKYRPIEPEKVEYDQVFENDEIKLSYRYDVLNYRGNPKLAKFERRTGLRVVAAAFTNKSTRTFNIDRDIDIFTDEEDPYYLDGITAAKRLQQHTRVYLFYSLLLYAKFDCDGRGLNCVPTYVIPAGVPLTVYNMMKAKKANRDMSKEFEKYSVFTRNIEPGQTVYAIL